jgi:hypothetical protein
MRKVLPQSVSTGPLEGIDTVLSAVKMSVLRKEGEDPTKPTCSKRKAKPAITARRQNKALRPRRP